VCSEHTDTKRYFCSKIDQQVTTTPPHHRSERDS
jgi:hypothetical protein